MEFEGINISLDEVSNTASSISSRNATLTDLLKKASSEVTNLSSVWQSEGGDTIISAMKKMEPEFENYRTIVEEYVKFLNSTVNAYQEAETQIKNSASSFEG